MKKIFQKSFRFWQEKKFFIISFLLFFLLFVSLYQNSLNGPWERDEGEYAYSAWLMEEGELPYRDSFLQKPPGIVLVYWLALKINPESLWPPRVLAFISIALTILLAGYIAKKEFDWRSGYFTLGILIPMFALPHFTPFSANVERFMLLPLLLVLVLYLNRQKSLATVFGAGFFGAMSFLFKPVILLVWAAIMLFWLWEDYLKPKRFGKIFPALGLFLWGVLVAAILVLGPFLWRGAGKFIWEEVFLFNKYYAAQMGQYIPSAFLKYGAIMLKNWWVVFVFSVGAIWMRFPKVWFYLLLIILGWFSIFSSPIGHYYFLLVPFLALLASAAFSKLCQSFSLNSQNGARPIVAILTFLSVFLLSGNLLPAFSLEAKENAMWIYGPGNPFLESTEVAEKIEKNSQADDKIFVAGSEPQIYFYAKRKSVSRFDITYPLIIDTPVREKYQKEAAQEIENNLPRLIAYSNRPESGLTNDESPKIFINYLDNLIQEKYILLGGYFRHSDLKGEWKDFSADFPEKKEATLLLYQKK